MGGPSEVFGKERGLKPVRRWKRSSGVSSARTMPRVLASAIASKADFIPAFRMVAVFHGRCQVSVHETVSK